MPSICFYFQVHQPYRMRHYGLFDVGYAKEYFDVAKNKEVCLKVANKCYLPANALMLELINQYPGKFKISYSISGVALEQFEEYCPAVLDSFKALAATGQVEFISETYYHSLAAMFNAGEFRDQVQKHRETIQRHFGITPQIFRNTELIYSNGIADMVEEMGFKAMLTEGVDRILDWRSPNFVYEPWNGRGMKLLLKNYKLSDDIAFRFSQRSWESYPLDANKFANWIHSIDGAGDTINLFMDYETIGEHQWEDTGIFEFFRQLPAAVMANPKFSFATPSEVIVKYSPVEKINIPEAISWADTERDLSAWLGNPMQDTSITWLYSFENRVKQSGDSNLLHIWRKLQTSDHFYYMCTKFWNDGDVHKYFSVYDTPHDSYTIMNNILTDLEMRLDKEKAPTPLTPKPVVPARRKVAKLVDTVLAPRTRKLS
jgi:alpha-amylase